VIDVALVSVIRCRHFRERIPLRQIAGRTRLSRNTIRRCLRSNIVEPAYSQRTSPSKLDDFGLIVPLFSGLLVRGTLACFFLWLGSLSHAL
jgi:hypothetical protein